jgi:hypothetical protein
MWYLAIAILLGLKKIRIFCRCFRVAAHCWNALVAIYAAAASHASSHWPPQIWCL